jgi:hypothetical protein
MPIRNTRRKRGSLNCPKAFINAEITDVIPVRFEGVEFKHDRGARAKPDAMVRGGVA